MSDTLTRINAYKRNEIAAAEAQVPLDAMKRRADKASSPRGFRAALERALAAGRYGLIAEIKRASPSKGVIRSDFDPASLARAYETGGATCLSVLTDGPEFQGSLDHLAAAREATSLPCLRKDFMLEPYQVYEARAAGADCILVIMASLTDLEATHLEEAALDTGLDVLVEVHDRQELARALSLKTRLIGINNRNLKTLRVDLYSTEELGHLVPEDRLVISESGISSPADLTRLAVAGARCFLIGEALMRQSDVAAATRTLLAPASTTVSA
jgi:indole-3-glycerol phosphate synthase